MVTFIATFDGGLSLYILLCAISAAVGIGLLRLVRLKLPLRSALVLAPVLTMAFWAVVLGIGVAVCTPVRYLAVGLWSATLVLAVYGLGWAVVPGMSSPAAPLWGRLGLAAGVPGIALATGRRCTDRLIRESWLLGVCALLPVVVMFRYFRAGLADYPGSSMPDGWSYAAYGQYLWNYPWNVSGGLAPLHEHPAGSYSRYIASSMLGFFSPFFSPGDTQAASGLFLAWSLFVFAASCAYFGLAHGLEARLTIVYLLLTVVSGWIYNLIFANNFDNALALAYFPALAGTIVSLGPQARSSGIILGLLGAGLLYSYPEVAPFVLGGALLILLDRCWQERADLGSWARTVGRGLVFMIITTSIYYIYMYDFMRVQIAAVSTSSAEGRPGSGFFPGLLRAGYQPSAFWGLGGEHPTESWLPVRNTLGILLTALAGTGLLRLIKRRNVGLAGVVVLLVGASLMFIMRQAYDYGAYKMILLNWWGLCFALVSGLDLLLARLAASTRGYVSNLICTLIVGCTLPFNHDATTRPCLAYSKYEYTNMQRFRVLDQLKEAVGDANLLVFVDDWLANEWAVYYLRDRPINLSTYRMYMGVEFASMDRARRVPYHECKYILTDDSINGLFADGQRWKLVWSGGPYRLWDPGNSKWALVSNLRKPGFVPGSDGLEQTVDVVASHAGIISLATAFPSGPSVPDHAPRGRLSVTHEGDRRRLALVDDAGEVFLPVRAGENRFTLGQPDPPTSDRLADHKAPPPLIGGKEGQWVPLQEILKLQEIPLSVKPIAINQAIWKDGVAEGIGDDPYLVFAAEEPLFVHAIRVKLHYFGKLTRSTIFQMFWRRSDRNDFVDAERNAVFELPTESKEWTLVIPVDDVIDQFRIDPDIAPCVFEFAEIVFLVPAPPVEKR